MAIDLRRRRLMLGAAAWAIFPGRAGASSAARGVLAAWSHRGEHYAGLVTPGKAPGGVALPFRPHDVVPDPRRPGEAIAVARRPGEVLARVDLVGRRIVALHALAGDRVSAGHAEFSPDGRLLTAESSVMDGSGRVCVRDPDTLEALAEFTTHGVGPHALCIASDGSILVANGGILTRPETGRRKHELDAMDSSLARLAGTTGRLLGQWRLPDPRLSIRHLAALRGGRYAVAMQAEHDDPDARARAPVLALLENDGLRVVPLPPQVTLGGYAGDVAWLPGHGEGVIAVSCTRADCVALWNGDGSWRRALPLAGVCALLSRGGRLIAGGSRGDMAVMDGDGRLRTHRHHEIAWDNHMKSIAVTA